MKVVINKCWGGFSISAKAVARIAELQGRPCFFYKNLITSGSNRISKEEAFEDKTGMISAYDVEDIYTVPGILKSEDFYAAAMPERKFSNDMYEKHSHTNRPDKRDDPLLIKVVEELGNEANGGCAELKIVEIPDGVVYEIDDYDGMESIHEVHRSWS